MSIIPCRRTALVGLLVLPGLMMVPGPVGAHESDDAYGDAAGARASVVHARGPLSDLQPAGADPTDGAQAFVLAVGRGETGAVAGGHHDDDGDDRDDGNDDDGNDDDVDAADVDDGDDRDTPRTKVVLRLRGLDRSAAGRTFGAHVHTGTCVPGNPAAAGPHYNHDVATVASPVVVSSRTEVWLDFRVTPAGTATAVAHVPFRIAPGAAGSVVVHRDGTDPLGAAGPRLACIAVDF